MVSLEAAHANEDRLLKYLDDQGIKYEKYSHPVVLTVDEQAAHVGNVPGVLAKNLLLKDKKGRLILVTALTTTTVDLKLLSQRLGLGKGGLRMAPQENLTAVLQVPEGSVTPLALFQETARSVPLLLDQGFQAQSRLLFHPLVNDATIGLEREAFEAFLGSIGREANYVDLEAVVVVGKDTPPDLAHLVQGSSVDAAPGGSEPSAGVAGAGAANAASQGAKPVAASSAKPAAAPASSSTKPSSAKPAKADAVKPAKATPPGDDVSACAQSILALVNSQTREQDGGKDQDSSTTSASDSSDSFFQEELQHILVMFKNAAYTQGFMSGRASLNLRS